MVLCRYAYQDCGDTEEDNEKPKEQDVEVAISCD
jgi:hypothetical protein